MSRGARTSAASAVTVGADDARAAALQALIDDAGLFPPARLPLDEALARHQAVRTGRYAWMVARFVCPADLLGDLVEATGRETGTEEGEEAWGLAVTLAADSASRLAPRAQSVRADADALAAWRLDQLEVRLPGADLPAEVRAAAEAAGSAHDEPARDGAPLMWCEAPDSTDVTDVGATITAAAAVRDGGRAVGVKVRCGGPTAESVPATAVLAEALSAAAALGVPLKATAGLHHPHRHHDDALGGWQHGFLNLLAAAALAWRGSPADRLAACLDEIDPDRLRLDHRGLRWADEHLDADALDAARRTVLRSIGSCSVDEPVDDLTALGVLPAGDTA